MRRKKNPARKIRHQVALAAHSTKTGLTHLFGDITEAQRLANQFKNARKTKLETELINSISFWAWIKGLAPISIQPSIAWEKPVFRLTDGWSPVSIVGSLSDGGRFNIGGAQLCPELPDVKKSGALYAASTIPEEQWKKIKLTTHGNSSKILLPLEVDEVDFRCGMAEGLTSWANDRNTTVVLYLGGEQAILKDAAAFSQAAERRLAILKFDLPQAEYQAEIKDLAKTSRPLAVQAPVDEQYSSYSGPVGMSWPTERYTKMGYSVFGPNRDTEYETRIEIFGETVIEMFRPIDGKLFFAGEHTALDYNGTMQGAVESGERTARMVLKMLREKQEYSKEAA